MKKKIRKIGMLSSIALMICLGVTGCYPDGKVSLEEKKETDSNQINIDENASHIEGKLDEGCLTLQMRLQSLLMQVVIL